MTLSFKPIIQIALVLLLFVSCNKKSSVHTPKEIPETESNKDKIIHLSTSAKRKDIVKYIRILEKAYAKIGYKVQVHEMPAVRSIHESNDGKLIDGEVVRTSLIKEMLPNQIKVPVLLDHVEVSAFSLDKSIVIDGWKSLKGKSIATVKGYWYFQKQLQEKSKLTQTKTAKNALQQLIETKIDAFVHIKEIGLNVIKQESLKGIYALEPPIDSIPTYHFINKKNATLIPDLAKAISEVTGNKIEK